MNRRSTLTLALPGILAVLPAGLWEALEPGPEALSQAATYPYLALGAVALLAWRFQRSRIVAAAVMLIIAHHYAAESGHLGLLVLPPCFALLSVTADRRVGAPRGLLQVAFGPVLGMAAMLAASRDPGRASAWLEGPLNPDFAWLTLPVASALVGLAAAALVTLYRRRALETGLLWAGAAGTAAAATQGSAGLLWTLGAALALGVALVEAAYALAYRDELTDLPTRRALNGLLSTLRAPYAIAIVDVDHFKRFNDRHGHDVGDQVLRMVAARLGAVGGGGQAFRSGGEEFTLVFPGSSKEDALPHLEEVRRAVANRPFVPRRTFRSAKGASKRGSGGKRGLKVTISVGVAAGRDRSATPEQVVKSADKAMYRAKQGGRNRVMA